MTTSGRMQLHCLYAILLSSIVALLQPVSLYGFSPLTLARASNIRSKMKMAMMETGEVVSKSLALNHVIYMNGESSEWRLVPIEHVSSSPLIGTMALQALEAPLPTPADNEDIILKCVSSNDSNNISVTFGLSDGYECDERYISTLTRIMVQSAISSKIQQSADVADITISFGSDEDGTIVIDKDTYSPSVLFQDIMGGDGFEMNELVNQKGESIGHVPRPLVHQFNLLHSGIGIIILAGDEDEDVAVDNPASVYVHRRTDTKRIFPSLYDMFVGGVCTAGEGLRETALREIEEELGLSNPNALSSSPHFTCTICTSYNRCVVALYSYQYKPNQESVQWQEEEVAWGDLVPYPKVLQTARASIERLQNNNQWPGGKTDIAISVKHDSGKMTNDDIPEWDYVPDGLLVWEAWLEWLQEKQDSDKTS